MITPRTAASSPAGVPGARTCHRCGEQNSASASYCLGCGTRLRTGEPEASVDEPTGDSGLFDDSLFDDDDWDDAPWDSGPSGPSDVGSPAHGSGGAADHEDNEWSTDEWPPDATAEAAAQPRLDTVYRLRLIGLSVLGLAFVIIVVATFLRDDDPDDTAASTTEATLVTGEDAQIYAAIVGELSADVTEFADRATQVNQRWDDEAADFAETLAALEEIESDVTATADRLRVEEPPDGIGAEPHQRLLASSITLSRAATGMVDGLQAPDTGEARTAELSRFLASADEFAAVADTIVQAIDFSAGQ